MIPGSLQPPQIGRLHFFKSRALLRVGAFSGARSDQGFSPPCRRLLVKLHFSSLTAKMKESRIMLLGRKCTTRVYHYADHYVINGFVFSLLFPLLSPFMPANRAFIDYPRIPGTSDPINVPLILFHVTFLLSRNDFPFRRLIRNNKGQR
jgi:hypothetical protein